MLKTICIISPDRVRLCQFQVSRRRRRLLKQINEPRASGVELADLIAGALKREKFSPAPMTVCFPRWLAGARFFEFPSGQESEISRMVGYEAQDILPLKPEETIVRHQIVRVRRDGYSDVFVAISPRQEIVSWLQRFSPAGIPVEVLALSTGALMSLFAEAASQPTAPEWAAGNVLVCLLDAGMVELCGFQNGAMVFSRGIGVDTAAQYTPTLGRELPQSLELFSAALGDQPVSAVVVAADGIDTAELVAALSPWVSVPLIAGPQFDLAVGLAMRRTEPLNLMDNEQLHSRRQGALRRQLIVTGVLLILAVLIIAGMGWMVVRQRQAYVAELEAELAQLRPQAQSIQEKLHQIVAVRSQRNQQVLILDALSELVRRMPDQCLLTMITIDEEGTVTVRGQASVLQSVLEYVALLDASAVFRDSTLNFSSRRKLKDTELLDFEIQAHLESAAAIAGTEDK